MQKPIIGIVGKAEPPLEEDFWHRITEADEFRYLTVKHGGVALMLLPTEATLTFNDSDIRDDTVLTAEELQDLYRQMDFCDGFILQGGLCSSQYEIEIARRALAQDKPLLGICAGFNNILRALGSDVELDETRRHDRYDRAYRHPVRLLEGTVMRALAGTDRLQVNSIHSMVAPPALVEPFATVSALSEDGLVESFELPDKRFVLGVKWHPELLLGEDYVDRLFAAFVDRCRP